MTNDQIKGMWKQIEGEAKLRWGRLTSDDWKQSEGSLEKLTGRIEERYGETKERVTELLQNIMSRLPSGGNAFGPSVPEQELAVAAPSGAPAASASPGWNQDQIKGKWKQIEGEARRVWGKLTDDDWKVIGGDIEKLAGQIQERYGDAKEVVTAQLQKLVGKFQETAQRVVDAARKPQAQPRKSPDGPVRGANA